MPENTITFGKYKNQPLTEVPSDYLEWLQGQGIKSPRLAEAVAAELGQRGVVPLATEPTAAAPSLDAALRQLDGAVAAVRAAAKR